MENFITFQLLDSSDFHIISTKAVYCVQICLLLKSEKLRSVAESRRVSVGL